MNFKPSWLTDSVALRTGDAAKQTTSTNPPPIAASPPANSPTNATPTPPAAVDSIAPYAVMIPKPKRQTRRLSVDLPADIHERLHNRARGEQRDVSKLIRAWIDAYLSACLVIVVMGAVASAHAGDSTFTTQQVLDSLRKFAATPWYPDFKLQATGGISSNTDTMRAVSRGGLLATFDLLDTREIRNNNLKSASTQAEALRGLAAVQGARAILFMLRGELADYRVRQTLTEQRVKNGIAGRDEVFAIEKEVVSLATSVSRAEIELSQAQINVAALAGTRWDDMLSIVKQWRGRL